MIITALVENVTNCELSSVHGLSFYVQTKSHNLLFDLGPDDTILKNAKKLNIDLSLVDIVIISHGHRDHGGALKLFLEINTKAKIYVQRKAFEKHYSKTETELKDISLESDLITHPQVVLLDGDYTIDSELSLFTVENTDKCYSCANDNLFSSYGKDDFAHEQNLIIQDDINALIIGCGHAGIVNILNSINPNVPKLCIGGFHLSSRAAKSLIDVSVIDQIAEELSNYPDTMFYTCHCTGLEPFRQLSAKMHSLFYLSCGQTIEF